MLPISWASMCPGTINVLAIRRGGFFHPIREEFDGLHEGGKTE